MSSSENKVHLEVRSKTADGFRRAGRFFGPDPVEDSFTEDAAQAIRNEPQLIVRELGAKATKATAHAKQLAEADGTQADQAETPAEPHAKHVQPHAKPKA